MGTLRVVKFGEEMLRESGKPVEHFDKALKALAETMLRTMDEAAGVGLAAQQVGLAMQFFVADFKPSREEETQAQFLFNGNPAPMKLVLPLAVANATIEPVGEDWALYEEGCLSFPGIRGDVPRPERVRMSYQDLNGERQTLETGGFLARILQHEFDHTQGVCFIERMERKVRAPLATKLKILKRQTRDFLKEQGAPKP